MLSPKYDSEESMRSIIVLILLSVLAACTPPKWESRVSAFTGTVSVSRAGKPLTVAVGLKLEKDDVLSTEKASTIDVTMNGGGVLRVAENSKLVMSQIGKQSELKIEKGRMMIGLNKLGNDETLRVATPTAIASVRGTAFGISALEDNSAKVAVLTGGVRVERNGTSVDLDALKEVRTDAKSKDLKAEKLKNDSADELKEILTIEGVEKLDGFDDLQKNVSLLALDANKGGIGGKDFKSREHQEKQ